MHQILNFKKAVLFFSLFIIGLTAFVQNTNAQIISSSVQITSVNLHSFSACGNADTIRVTVTNVSSSAISDCNVRVKMPLGFHYINNSVFGGGVTQQSLIGNDSIIFNIPNLSALGGNITFFYTAKVSCDILTYIQNFGSGNIKNRIDAFWNTNNFFNRLTTSAIPVLVPSVSVSMITNQNYSSSINPPFTFTRTIRVTNGGNGYILPSSLKFLDANTANISIQSVLPNFGNMNLNGGVNGDSTIITFSASDIINHALNDDGDSLLEQNEYFEFTETVQVSGCTNLISNMIAYWGCLGNTCISTTNNNQTSASVTLPNLFPSLNITGTLQRAYKNKCFNAGKHLFRQQSYKIKNTGNGSANNIILNPGIVGAGLNINTTLASWIDTASFYLQYNNGSFVKLHPISVSSPISSGLAFVPGTPHYAQVSIKINSILAGDSAVLIYNMIDTLRPSTYCGQNDTWGGATLQPGTYQNYCNTVTYNIPQGTGGSVGFTIFGLSYSNNLVPTDAIAGNTYTFSQENFTLISLSDFTANDRGIAALVLKFDNGLTWNGNLSQVGFTGPTGALWNPYKYYQHNDTVVFYWRVGQIPTIYANTTPTFSFKVNSNCSGVSGGTKFVFYNWTLNTDSTCVGNNIFRLRCGTMNTSLHCAVPCPTGGLAFEDFKIQRINFGKGDTNNNGLPDGNIDLNKIRTERYMFGDTILMNYRGQIKLGSVTNFTNGYAKSNFTGNTGFIPVNAKVRLIDSATHTVYSLNNVPITFSNPMVNGFSYKSFSIDFSPSSLRSLGLPLSYTFKQGDSVLIDVKLRCTYNPGQATNAITESNEFFISTVANPTLSALKYQCDGFSGALTSYGIRTYGPSCGTCNATTVNSCGITTVTGSFFCAVGGGSSNFDGGNAFPFEYRPWTYQKSIVYKLPVGYEFVAAFANFFFTGGSGVTTPYSNIPIPTPTRIGDSLIFNLSPLYTINGGTIPISDDGWRGNYNIVIQPTCEVVNGATELNYWLGEFKFTKATIDTTIWGWSDNLLGNYGFFESGKSIHGPLENYGSSITYLQPVLKLNSTFLITDALTNPVDIDFTIANQSGTSNADSVWVSAQNLPSGMIINSIIELPSGNVLKKKNDIYKVGNILSNGIKNLRVNVTFESCNIDSFKLFTGWNCSKYPTTFIAKKCMSDSITLRIFPKQAELQLVALNNKSTNPLCAIDTFFVDVLNPQIANAKNVKVFMKLPQGMNFVPGSAHFSYPLNSPYITIADPVAVIGQYNQYSFSINNSVNALIDSIGLPGLANAPLNNHFKLMFAVNTDCNYLSGSTLSFNTTAQSPCGTDVNKFITPANALNITGATKPYDTKITFSSPNGYNSCRLSNVNPISVKINNIGTGATGVNDKFYFDAPLGSTYGASSFSGIHNAPSVGTPTVSNVYGVTRFEWSLPSGIVSGDSMQWDFNLILATNLPCGFFTLSAMTTAPAPALFCASLPLPNQTCTIYSLTGVRDSLIENVFPDVRFTNLSSTSKVDCITNSEKVYFNATVLNTSTTAILPGANFGIKIYADKDGDNQITSVDSLIGSAYSTAGLGYYQSLSIADSTELPAGFACKIIAAFDTTNLCLCSGTFNLSTPIYLQNAGAFKTVCGGVPVQIGDCSIGSYTYQWSPIQGLSNATVSNPVATIQNNTANPVQYLYYLITNRGNGCVNIDSMVITINPSSVNAGNDVNVCKGLVRTLQGSSPIIGETYTWSSASYLSNSAIPTPIVNTDTVGIKNFIITGTSPLGCIASDTMQLKVFALPPIQLSAANDSVCNATSVLLTPSGYGTITSMSWFNQGIGFSNTVGQISVSPISADETYVAVVVDSNSCSAADTIKIHTNQLPIASGFTTNTNEDVIIFNQNLFNGAIDPENDSMQLTIIKSASNGVMAVAGNGIYNYQPNLNYFGSDTVTYSICNTNCSSDCVTNLWVINVIPIADGPTAVIDTDSTGVGVLKIITVLTNDMDVDGLSFSITSATPGTNGTTFINTNGTITYTPNSTFFGLDSFTYTICDINGILCSTAKVYVKVSSGNIAPIAGNDTITVLINSSTNISVLNNDSDPNNNPIEITTIGNPIFGFASLVGNQINYTALPGFYGVDSFQYTICDTSIVPPFHLCSTAWVVVNIVAPLNAVYNSSMVNEDASVTIPVLANDTLISGETVTIFITQNATHGTAFINTNGTVDYTPQPDFNGNDTFIYNICYNNIFGICDTAMVIIKVLPINDKPVAVNDVKSTSLNTNVQVSVLNNDTDADTTNVLPQGKNLSVSLPITLQQPLHGSILVVNNIITYQPNLGYTGIDSFEYKICDNGIPSLCDTAKVFIAVASNVPTARFDLDTLLENTFDTIFVLQNDSAYGNIVSSFVSTNPLHGIVLQLGNGSIKYTPNNHFSGDDYFIYTYCAAGSSICDTAIVLIHVLGINGKPIAFDDVIAIPASGMAGTSVQSVSINDQDDDSNILPEGNISTATISVNVGIAAPKHGITSLNPNGKFTYTPFIGFTALGLVDSFQYIICDNGVPNLCDTAWVKIFVGACTLHADAGLNQNVCVGNSINIGGSTATATGGSGVYTYQWISSHQDTIASIANPLVTPSVNTTYYVTVTDGTGCFSTDSVVLTIQQAAIVSFNLDSMYCSNSALVNLIGSPSGGIFSGNGLQTVAGSTFLNPALLNININEIITYTYTNNGCTNIISHSTKTISAPDAKNDTVDVSNEGLLLIDVVNNDIISLPPKYFIAVTSFTSNATATIINNQIQYTPNVGFIGLDSVGYLLSDTSSLKNCADAAMLYIRVNPKAINDTFGFTTAIDCEVNLYEILKNDYVGLSTNSISVFIDQPTSNGELSVSANTISYKPNVGFVGIDSLKYSLIVNGLTSKATAYFNTECRAECKFAQGLSPNEDGKNDVFKIDCTFQYPANEVVIFNRWGNEVYRANPYKNDWKGTYQNQTLPDGTYYYIFKYNDNKHDDKQGYIVIHK
ncbi:MAG: hypothetical protein RL065_976 [Bacteroidota bacterium]